MHKKVRLNKIGIKNECYQKSLRINYFPYWYHIHLNMFCNQKCIMCKPSGKQTKDILPFEKFVELFEQIKPYAEHITLTGGEPFLYPEIYNVIEMLSEHEIAVTINTNCTILDEKLSEKLVSLHELHLKCSIDAVTRRTYHKIRGTDMFEQVKTNIERFAALVKYKQHIKQILVYVVMRENMGEVLPFIDYAKMLSPTRIEFHPVRHVTDWIVSNKTGWIFDGKVQSCEFFIDEYNDLMRQAAEKCEKEELCYETLFI